MQSSKTKPIREKKYHHSKKNILQILARKKEWHAQRNCVTPLINLMVHPSLRYLHNALKMLRVATKRQLIFCFNFIYFFITLFIVVWAIIFLTKLRFPSRISIATVLKKTQYFINRNFRHGCMSYGRESFYTLHSRDIKS